MSEPSLKADLGVGIDHGQLYIYDLGASIDLGGPVALEALDDAQNSGRYVGRSGDLVNLLSPVQWHFDAPMRVEVWAGEPAPEEPGWDHVVDLDLNAPTGQLAFQAPTEEEYASCAIPHGRYRIRVSGRGYDHANPQGGGGDSYRVQLWPRTGDRPPAVRKRWAGWSSLMG